MSSSRTRSAVWRAHRRARLARSPAARPPGGRIRVAPEAPAPLTQADSPHCEIEAEAGKNLDAHPHAWPNAPGTQHRAHEKLYARRATHAWRAPPSCPTRRTAASWSRALSVRLRSDSVSSPAMSGRRLVVGVAYAACANKCSGHGRCTGVAECTCYGAWTGADCSLRESRAPRQIVGAPPVDGLIPPHRATDDCEPIIPVRARTAGKCPWGTAWADVAIGTDLAHQPAECSGRGTCNTASGECQCMAGFEGISCSRSE